MSAKKAVGVAALDAFDESEDPRAARARPRAIGGELVAEFFADVREIHARQDQHAAILGVQLGSQRREERFDARIARRRDSARDHLVKRADEDRHDLVAAHSERVGEEQRLEFDRMLAAMQHLVGEEITLIARSDPIDKRRVGRRPGRTASRSSCASR